MTARCGPNDRNTYKGEVVGSSPPGPNGQISKCASIFTFSLFGALPQKTVLSTVCHASNGVFGGAWNLQTKSVIAEQNHAGHAKPLQTTRTSSSLRPLQRGLVPLRGRPTYLVTNSSCEARDTKSKRLNRKFRRKHFDHFVRLYSMTANSQIPGG
jgi:hypothetical protein